jgi:hypothetical protein
VAHENRKNIQQYSIFTADFRAMSLNVDHSLDGQSRYSEIVAILVAGSVLSTLAVAARALTRTFILHTFGLDDAIMVIAQVHKLLLNS